MSSRSTNFAEWSFGRWGQAAAFSLALFAAGSASAGPFDTLFGSPTSLPASAAVDPLVDPPEFRSENGQLSVTLDARPTRVDLGKFHSAPIHGRFTLLL